MPQLYDAVELADARVNEGGYLVANARFARTGIQIYRGSELGRPDLGDVRVLRSEDEVFDAAAMGRSPTDPSPTITRRKW